MKLAVIQLSTVENDKAATLEKAAAAVGGCGDADLVILPELWNIGFTDFDRYAAEAEAPGGGTLSLMKELARQYHIHLHTGSFVEKVNGHLYNTSYLLAPDGSELAVYRKIHLFGFNSRETKLLTPGDSPVVVDTPFGRAGMSTCFDLRFPELFRFMTDQGARIFLVCSAWPYPRLEHWLLLGRARAVENQSFLIACNAAGNVSGTLFVGHSMVVDPWGNVLAGTGDGDAVVRTSIDLDTVDHARKAFPGLSSRRAFLNPGLSRD